MKKVLLLSLPFAAVLMLGVGTAQSATFTTVANYQMNETSGATVLVDSGSNHINGTIGTSVQVGGGIHNWPSNVVRGLGGTVDPQRLDIVNNSALNPGTSDFKVTVRLKIRKLSDSLGNVMQKGQTGSPTGFWKIELDGAGTRGQVFCGFRSIVNGKTTNGGIRSPINIADNQWHVVTCERAPTYVSTTVDGQVTKQMHAVGNIVNNVPLTIGGKANCNATLHHLCDYFEGSMDYVTIQKG